jgi:hypothetical protein
MIMDEAEHGSKIIGGAASVQGSPQMLTSRNPHNKSTNLLFYNDYQGNNSCQVRPDTQTPNILLNSRKTQSTSFQMRHSLQTKKPSLKSDKSTKSKVFGGSLLDVRRPDTKLFPLDMFVPTDLSSLIYGNPSNFIQHLMQLTLSFIVYSLVTRGHRSNEQFKRGAWLNNFDEQD